MTYEVPLTLDRDILDEKQGREDCNIFRSYVAAIKAAILAEDELYILSHHSIECTAAMQRAIEDNTHPCYSALHHIYVEFKEAMEASTYSKQFVTLLRTHHLSVATENVRAALPKQVPAPITDKDAADLKDCSDGLDKYISLLHSLADEYGDLSYRVQYRKSAPIVELMDYSCRASLMNITLHSKLLRDSDSNSELAQAYRTLYETWKKEQDAHLTSAEKRTFREYFADIRSEANTLAKQKAADRRAAFSDDKLAQRFIAELPDRVYQNRETGQLELWVESRKEWVTKDIDVCKGITAFKNAIIDSEKLEWQDVRAIGDQNKFLSSAKTSGIFTSLRRNNTLEIRESVLDLNPAIIGLPNGLMQNLRTGEVRARSHSDYITMQAGVIPQQGDTSSWNTFLRQITCGDEEYLLHLRLTIGYFMTGSVKPNLFYLLRGPGRNGKGVFARILLAVLGDYGHVGNNDLLYGKDEHPDIIADIDKKRLLIFEELDHTKTISPAMKALTGGMDMRGREMRENYRKITVHAKPVLLVNVPPRFDGGSFAIKERLQVFPFNFNAKQVLDRNLADKLLNSLPAIAYSCFQDAKRYLREVEPKDGTSPIVPSSVIVTTSSRKYLVGTDIIGDFLANCSIDISVPHYDDSETIPTKISNTTGATKQGLYRCYAEYCKENGLKPTSSHSFKTALEAKGYKFALHAKWRTLYCYNIILSNKLKNDVSFDSTNDVDERGQTEIPEDEKRQNEELETIKHSSAAAPKFRR